MYLIKNLLIHFWLMHGVVVFDIIKYSFEKGTFLINTWCRSFYIVKYMLS